MPEYTSNYKLYKPSRKDDVVVDESLTENFTKIDSEIKNRSNEIGQPSNLTTANKNNTVSAINELDKEIGTISSLSTSKKTNLVEAVNEIVNNVGHLSALNTTEKTSVVLATNEVVDSVTVNKDNIGELVNLKTEDKENLVNAINEINDTFIESNKGVFNLSGDGVETSATIPHELSDTPRYFSVQEASEDAGDAAINFIEVDDTNITVHFKSELSEGTDNISLVWRAEL